MEEYILSRPHERGRPKLKMYDLTLEALDITEVCRIQNRREVSRELDMSKYTKVIAPDRQYADDQPYYSLHYRPMKFDSKGIAKKFAKLESNEEKILDFAEHYGFLGIKFIDDLDPYDYNMNPVFLINPYSDIHFEPLEVWQWHIKHVGRLLKLHNALDQFINHDEHYLDDLLALGDPAHSGNGVNVYWRDGMIRTNTRISHITYEKDGGINYREAAEQVLIDSIFLMFDRAINYRFTKKVPNASARLGFRTLKEPCTPYLLAAIYYDLSRMIDDDEESRFCKACGKPLEKKRRDAEFCDKTCTSRYKRKNPNHGGE